MGMGHGLYSRPGFGIIKGGGLVLFDGPAVKGCSGIGLYIFWVKWTMDPVCSSNVNQGTNFVLSEIQRTQNANLHKYYSKGP